IDVVAVELAVPPRVAWRHRGAARAEDEPFEQSRGAGTAAGGSLARALLQNGLNPIPELAVDDRLVLARVGCALVPGLPDVHRVGDDPVEATLLDRFAALGRDALGREDREQLRDG